MKFSDLNSEEQKIFIEVAKAKAYDEVFMQNGENYFPLVAKGLLKEIPNADFLAASVILTEEGKKMRDQLIKEKKIDI